MLRRDEPRVARVRREVGRVVDAPHGVRRRRAALLQREERRHAHRRDGREQVVRRGVQRVAGRRQQGVHVGGPAVRLDARRRAGSEGRVDDRRGKAPVGADAWGSLALHRPLPSDTDRLVAARVGGRELRLAHDERVAQLHLLGKVEEEPDAVVEEPVRAVDEVSVLVHEEGAEQLVQRLPLLDDLRCRSPRGSVVAKADAPTVHGVAFDADGVAAEARPGWDVVLAVDVAPVGQVERPRQAPRAAFRFEPDARALVDRRRHLWPDPALPHVGPTQAHVARVHLRVAVRAVARAHHGVAEQVSARV
mmetsp:Transcript_3101/g.7015  ORF Transcript_3101/g.7015 Transcript_3101/m.7015 type:complete len:306 (-) Transcript_3101:1379-2296(-)